MDSGVTLRTFLALPLAPAFQKEVEPLLEGLRRDYPGVRWVKGSEIHITLHFFGSVGQDEIGKITKIVNSVTGNIAPLQLSLGGIGAFPHPGKPRVVWLGAGGETEKLKGLRSALEREFRKAGFPCEEREFKPHLTLGRVKEGKKVTGLEKIEFKPTPEKRLSELVLFQSHLSPEGAHYERIATFPLSST